LVRVAGSDRACAAVLVVRKFRTPAWHEKTGISVKGHGAIRARGSARGDRTRDPASLRGSGAASASALPGTVLHGAGGGVWRLAGAVCAPPSGMALAGIVRPA